MACGERGGSSKFLLCVGLFLVATCHCKKLTKLKALDTPGGNSMLGRGQAKGGEVSHGRLLIGPNFLQGAKLNGNKATENFQDYQGDMGWGQPKQPKGDDNDNDEFSKLKHDDVAVERLLKMEPKVECTGDSMKLKVQDAASTPGSLLFVDRGKELSPLPLSKLPASCGYTIRSTRRDLVLVAPYDGCFVTLQEDSYILPLRWWGLPVKMSCPSMRQTSTDPPMVTCHAEGMVVKTEWTVPVAKIKVNLNGNWEPLMKASPRCGFGVVVHPEGVVISVGYASCLEKKDGMYTLELAGEGEVKISCPSMLPAPAEPTESQAKAPKEQTDTPGKGGYPSAPEPPSQNPAQSAVPQVPGFPENPKVPNEKQNQDVYQPQLPYFPFPPGIYPANPDPKPTPAVQPNPPPVTKKYGQQPHHPVPPAKLPLNPGGQVPNPFNPSSEPPQNPKEESWGQRNPQFNQYAFLPQGPYQMPVLPRQPTPAPRGKDEQPLSPWQPEVSTPKAPENPQGQVPQQFNPHFYYYPTPEDERLPAEKPTAVPAPSVTEKPTAVPQPEAPQGQVPQQFNPYFYYYPRPDDESLPAEKPTAVPGPPATEKPAAVPQPEAPQGQVPQQFNPYFYYYPTPEDESPPAEKPTAVPGPPATEKPAAVPQPEAPQGQVPQQFNPYFYYYPTPEDEGLPAEKPTAVPGHPVTEKPTAVPKPSQPEAPQGQVPQQFNPYFYYYPRPDDESLPAEKPTAVPGPPATEKPAAVPQPEAPQGQVPQQFNPYFYYYPRPDESPPAEKPTAVPGLPATEKPAAVPQPEAPQGQVPQQFNPYYYYYYPTPEDEGLPAEKPTAVPAPSATEKPTAIPKPSQPEAPQGQVPQQFNPYFYYYPRPDDEGLPAEKSTAVPGPPATKKPAAVPQPEAPQGQVPQQFNPYFYYYPRPDDEGLPAEKSTAVPLPPAIETPKGQVHKPLYPQPFKIPGPGTNEVKPTETPVPSEQPPVVNPTEGQVPYPFGPYYFPQQPKHPQPVTLPPATSMQQPQEVTTLASGQAPQPGSSYVPPMHCPQYCSPGYANCCPQIAFHQHLHHIVPAGTGSEKLPSIYPGMPFLPSAYSGFDNGFVPAAPPLKPTESVTTSTSAPISTQSPPSGNKKQPYYQPPDGNPAVLPENNPSKPTNPGQIYPYFVPNLGYPYQPYQPQNELQNLPQRQSPAHYTVPSKTQAPGYEPVNQMPASIQPPTQQNNQPSARDMNEPSGPNFWSRVSQSLRQHTAKRQSRPESLNSTQPQPFLSASKKSIRDEQNVNHYFEPKSYVLLQHGPPGREHNSFSEYPLPFRHLVHDPNFLAQNLAMHQGSKPQHPQNVMPPHKKAQHPKWQGKVMSSPLPGNVNHMPRPSEKSESWPLLYSASAAPQLMPSPQDPMLNPAHLMPGKAFQQLSSAATHETNGLNQPIQTEGGNSKQK